MRTVPIATRRELLTTGLGLVGVGGVLPNFLIRTALGGPKAEPGQRVLVVLQLHGGNDALSTLVPYGHKEYHEYRKTTRIEEKEVIKLNEELGLHPNMQGSRELLDQGAFAALPGVGMPNPNYSHFTSTRIWQAANPAGPNAPTGWVGRAMDVAYKGNQDPKLALGIGTGRNVWALIGDEHPGLSFSNPASFRYTGDRGNESRAELYRKLNEMPPASTPPQLDWVTGTAVRANSASDRIREVAARYKPCVEYPDSRLGRYLQIIAGLIVGGLSTRVYWTRKGGFDTHRGQRDRHDSLWQDLDGAITAFFKDLTAQKQADRVLLMTMSEFSRTTKENGNDGTDHSAAGAHFLWGPGVKPGIHGEHPSLKEDDLIRRGWALQHTQDYRSLYATVLQKWLGIPCEPVLGKKYPLIDCIA